MITEELTRMKAGEAASVHCAAGVRVNGRKSQLIVSVEMPNIVVELRRDPKTRKLITVPFTKRGAKLGEPGSIREFRRRVSSLDVEWRHPPCPVCEPFRESVL